MSGKGSGGSGGSTGQVISVELERSVALQLLQALSVATGDPCRKTKGGKSNGKSDGKDGGKSTGKDMGKSTGKAG